MPRTWSKKATLVALRLCMAVATSVLIVVYPPESGISLWLTVAWVAYLATTAGYAWLPETWYRRARFDLTFIALELALLGTLFAIYGGAETWFFYPLFLLVVLLSALARRLSWSILLGAGVSIALALIVLENLVIEPGPMILQVVTLLVTAGMVGFLTEDMDRTEAASVQFENAFEVSALLADAIDAASVYERLTDVLARMFHAQRVAVILANEDDQHGRVVAAVDGERAVEELEIDLDLYPEIRTAIKERRAVVIDRPDKHPGMRGVRELLPPELKGMTMLVTPIRQDDRVRGVVFIRIDNVDHCFSDEQIRFCRLMADIAGKALRRADHFEQVSEAARRDPLTGLYNVRAFRQALRDEIARSERSGTSCSLLMIDVDFLKHINDTYGHQAGDHVLRNLATIFAEEVRLVDVVARYGGEEFAVLLADANGQRGAAVGERLRERAERMRHGRVREAITVSIGVAAYPEDAASAEDLIRMADEALYASKFQGRNRTLRYSAAVAGKRENGADGEEPAIHGAGQDTAAIRSVRRALEGVHSNRQIMRNMGAIASLATLMRARDPAALERIEDSATLSRMFLRTLTLSDREKATIHLACLLRDIGKLAVEGEILNKWDTLTREERDTVREHPVISAQVAATMRGLDSIVPIIRHHHERWDGTGYPDGLAQEAIPFGARVVGLIDALQAMLSMRPGQDRAHGFEYARTEIEQGAGTQFDPELAHQLLAAMDAHRLELQNICAHHAAPADSPSERLSSAG